MKRIFFFTILLIFSLLEIQAKETDTIPEKKRHPMAFSGYQGGMMFHLGYVQSKNFQFNDLLGNPLENPYQLKGMAYGIGGAIRVGFGKHLRVGMEGYVSTHKYGPNASSAKIGWGGLLLDSHWKIDKVTIFAGGVIGGGSYTHSTLTNKENESSHDYKDDFTIENQDISFRKYPFLVIDPFFGVEYALTKRISAVAKIDYMLNATNWSDDYINGPRFFIGIMFGR